ncbi:histidine kinase [Hymenobacter sp. BRD128]|uniref:sensor histidine kinase n=1 Tax=Hymenobacter sp. BRD128 TaxID=2675878 RepID=UPI0015634FB5|nr:histidine kinase [Hymenobacter sp. BRD128]QKG55858.1 histidine kinase [Hymenobacter sp. BRD128]
MLYLKKFFRWHVLAWTAYFGYVVLGGLIRPETAGHNPRISLAQNVWLDASFLVARITTFYFCYLLVFPRLLRVGRLPLLVLGLGAVGPVFAGVRAALEEGLYPWLLGFQNYWPGTSLSMYLFDGFYYAIPNSVLAAALWAAEQVLHRERENQQLVAARRTAELAFLKTQLNPHFLYNTLNMLYGLAYGVDKALAGGLLKLSELMRYMLRDTPDGLVDLREEIEYLANFLDLYRLRYPGRLHAALTVTGDPAGHRVAPLLLIPFVENAFKHGVLDDPATPVRLHLVLTPGAIEFTVENQRHNYQPDHGSGIGLANLHRRLELLYPDMYAWQVGPEGQQFRAHLRLDVPARATVLAATAPMETLLPALAVVSA